MFNPSILLKLKSAKDKFSAAHPKFISFLNAAYAKGVREGTVLDVSFTTPEGETLHSNIRLSAEDAELFAELSSLLK